MKTKPNPSSDLHKILFASLFGSLCGLALTFLCTLALSMLIEHAVIPETGVGYAFLTVIPGALAAGMITAARAGRRMLLYGLLGGVVFFLLLLLLSALLLPDLAFRSNLLPVLACSLAASALGSILAPQK